MNQTIVVYYSRKGHVKKLAERIALERSADLCPIVTDEPTKGFLGFWWCGRFGMHRWAMPIRPMEADPASYARVILVSPVWVFTVSAPMRAFLAQYAGKLRHVEIVLAHFSFPMRYPRTLAQMDRALGVTHERFTSVACPWGRVLRRREFVCP